VLQALAGVVLANDDYDDPPGSFPVHGAESITNRTLISNAGAQAAAAYALPGQSLPAVVVSGL
jgi:hypothetical protein